MCYLHREELLVAGGFCEKKQLKQHFGGRGRQIEKYNRLYIYAIVYNLHFTVYYSIMQLCTHFITVCFMVLNLIASSVILF